MLELLVKPKSDLYQSSSLRNSPSSLDSFGHFKRTHGVTNHCTLAISRSFRPVLEHTEAERVVKEVLDENNVLYEVLSFKEFRHSHQGALLKSKKYEKYFVLCHKNTRFHAGFMVCPYLTSNCWSTRKGLLSVDPKRGGTNRFWQHLLTHEKESSSAETVKVWIQSIESLSQEQQLWRLYWT